MNLSSFHATPELRAAHAAAKKLDSWPGLGDFRRDAATGALALRYLEHFRPSFLFVALGESDEFAHRGDYRGYLGAITEADRTIGAIARTLEGFARRGDRTALFVTADHGRARSFRDHGSRYPESAAVWLVATGTEVGRTERTASGARRLADIAPTARHVLGLERDAGERSGTLLSELLRGTSGRLIVAEH